VSGLTFLLGGARSGKSSLAVELAERAGGPVTFIATATAGDDEMAARIEAHRAERPGTWTTVEEPIRLLDALEAAEGTVVVDCLSLWVANLLEDAATEIEEQAVAAASVAARRGRTIAVSNEVGLGVVPATPLGRCYRDVLGRVNAAWAEAAEVTLLVVAGRALPLSSPWELVDA
jgi:adenosyl cobinamide kinase/adenosyl cobinamide phosphate guanylyltransferase